MLRAPDCLRCPQSRGAPWDFSHLVIWPVRPCTWPYWIWAPNSVFVLWRLIFPFLTSKSIVFLAPYKIPERWIYHTTIGPQIPFLGSGRIFLHFWPLKVHIFFIYIQFPIDWWVTWPMLFLSPPVPSLGIRRIPNFFWLRSLSIKLQNIQLSWQIDKFGLVFALDAYKTFLNNHFELSVPLIPKKTCYLRINV
jgi:hypothetical protein